MECSGECSQLERYSRYSTGTGKPGREVECAGQGVDRGEECALSKRARYGFKAWHDARYSGTFPPGAHLRVIACKNCERKGDHSETGRPVLSVRS
jgi:hypothetical protein